MFIRKDWVEKKKKRKKSREKHCFYCTDNRPVPEFHSQRETLSSV